MNRIRAALLALCLLFSLTGCALQSPNTPQPTPEPDPVITPEPLPEPLPEPKPEPAPVVPDPVPMPNPVLRVSEKTESAVLGSTPVTITQPVVELQNTSAAEIIHQYFSMLSGKVRDYAEGDLALQPGISCTVTAGHTLTYSSASALSFLWKVETATSSPELPGSTTVSAVTFDPVTGRLLTFRDVFGDKSGTARDLFIAKARTVIAQRAADHYYFEGWNELAASGLDEACYYLTETGVCLFYPREALGTYTEVPLTWDELSACLAITP